MVTLGKSPTTRAGSWHRMARFIFTKQGSLARVRIRRLLERKLCPWTTLWGFGEVSGKPLAVFWTGTELWSNEKSTVSLWRTPSG